jgi:hypothetical protein
MASNLNKKYFGNRNIGTGGNQTNNNLSNSQNNSDDRIGGEGIASINWSNLGLFRGNDATNSPLVGLELPAPTLPGGVQATWTVTFEVASVSTGSGKAGLVVGDTYTYAAGGSPTITVATISGTNATFTTTAGSGLAYGSLPTDTTGVNITKVTGSGPATFLTDINFKVKSATINEKGSGYTGAETFTVTTYSATTGAAPAGTIVLTTGNGVPYNANNQENALTPFAYVTGGTRKVADIIRQVGGRRYKVKTADGTMTCSLKTSAASNAAGEMDLTATDSSGKTYYVKKLTGHKATLVRYGSAGHEFATDTAVQWTFGAASSGVSVTIANA